MSSNTVSSKAMPSETLHSIMPSNTTLTNQLGERWVLASNNNGKLKELQQMLDGYGYGSYGANKAQGTSLSSSSHADKILPSTGVTVIPQAELGIDDAIEDGLSFVENALIKARHASRLSGLPAIADDSGLCVPVLGNAPGIYSARYAGEPKNDANNITHLLAQLAPHREAPIKAFFVCVLVWVRHAQDPMPLIAQGVWHGEIAEQGQGDHGFGYDPVFYVPELAMTAAELSPAQKQQYSHRGQAMRSLCEQLQNLYV